MIGVVLVSVSSKLAEAIAALARQNPDLDFPVATATAIHTNQDEFPDVTSQIAAAVLSIYPRCDGVLMMADSQTSFINAETVCANLANTYNNIKVSPAPLVEGFLAVVSRLSPQSSLQEAYEWSLMATFSKPVQYTPGEAAFFEACRSSFQNTLSYRFKMSLPRGLHSRPASELVNLLEGYSSTVTLANVSRQRPPVNAKSLNKLTLSSVRQGDDIEIVARGEDAPELIQAVRALVEDNFNIFSLSASPSPPDRITAADKLTVLSPGVGIGTLICADNYMTDVMPVASPDYDREIESLKKAVLTVKNSLNTAKTTLEKQGLSSEAAIFEAHIMILEDTDILNDVFNGIRSQKVNAAYIYQQKMFKLADDFRNLSDPYIREKAVDIIDVAKQVINCLVGRNTQPDSGAEAVIIAAQEVTPSMVGQWKANQLKGIITTNGSPSSHVAILAKALGVPAIAGYRLPSVPVNGRAVVMDTSALQVVIEPDKEVLEDFKERYDLWLKEINTGLQECSGPAVSQDGYRIPVLGNVVDISTAEAALKHGAEGIGLLRTEFMFMNRRVPPTEEEQLESLGQIFKMFEGMPVTVRTLDVGGDKFIPWLPLNRESNPFLGLRGVRLYPQEIELFYTQLRAILRAGYGYDVKIMLPMVSVTDEVVFAREALEKTHSELVNEGIPHLWPVPVGIMVETPSVVMMAEEFASRVDFFSIGTNDLCQYIMAAERGAKGVEHLVNPMQPALLKAIQSSVKAARKYGIDICVCGEMAGTPELAEVLLGFGVNNLSMNAGAIGQIKKMIRHSSIRELGQKVENIITHGIKASSYLEVFHR